MKKKNWKIRILCLIMFLGFSGIIMYTIYGFSSENGQESSMRSETVTEAIKQEVNTKLNERGLRLKDKIKYYVILHSPYGSDWNANVRKLAHFSIYFALSCMVYISFVILGVNKTLRFLFAVALCFLFAMGDEYHQSFTAGRGSSMNDVLLDSFGALCGASMMTVFAWIVSGIHLLVNRAYDDKQKTV